MIADAETHRPLSCQYSLKILHPDDIKALIYRNGKTYCLNTAAVDKKKDNMNNIVRAVHSAIKDKKGQSATSGMVDMGK